MPVSLVLERSLQLQASPKLSTTAATAASDSSGSASSSSGGVAEVSARNLKQPVQPAVDHARNLKQPVQPAVDQYGSGGGGAESRRLNGCGDVVIGGGGNDTLYAEGSDGLISLALDLSITTIHDLVAGLTTGSEAAASRIRVVYKQKKIGHLDGTIQLASLGLKSGSTLHLSFTGFGGGKKRPHKVDANKGKRARSISRTAENKIAAASLADRTQTADGRQLPPRWRQRVDPDKGDTYFYHKDTNFTSWNFPTAVQVDLEAAAADTIAASARTSLPQRTKKLSL